MQAPPSPARTDTVVQSLQAWQTLVVTGPDRCSWLDGLVTCDAKNLQPGEATWGLILNRLGKIQSALYILQTENALWICLAPETIDSVVRELDRMLIMEDAELERPEQPQSWFALHGPQSLDTARQLAENSEADCAALDSLGLGGAILRIAQADAADRLAQAPLLCLSEQQWTRLRLERGMPEVGVDFTNSDRPHEAGLERKAVNWNKGCYLGQEVVCTQDMRGKVKRSSRVLKVMAPPEAAVGDVREVSDEQGGVVGRITSCAYSPRAQSWLVMARMKMDKLNSPMTLRCNDASYSAELGKLF